MGLRQLCKLFMGVRFSHPPPIIVDYSDVAQPAEQFLHTEKVGGSVPSVTTISKIRRKIIWVVGETEYHTILRSLS